MFTTVSRRTLLRVVLVSSLALQGGATRAQSAIMSTVLSADPSALMPQPPETAAKAFILVDMSCQQVLAVRHADQPADPASLTKLMTAYLVFQALQQGKLQLQQEVVVSERAWRAGMAGTSRALVPAQTRVQVETLLKAMVVLGSNDAAVALAEAVGGGAVDSFVAMMNRQAQVLGLKATAFKNPDGQKSAGHISTARELAWLAMQLITDFPTAMPYFALKEFSFNGVRQPSRNLLLLRDPSVDGLQTGYAEGAGYGQVASARRATPAGERRLLSVVMGTTSPEARANESQKLLNWGYSAFDAVRLFDAGQPVSVAPVWKGAESSVPLGRRSPLLVAVPRGQAGSIKTMLVRNDPLMAPIRRGQVVATLKVTVSGQPWLELPMQALEPVASAGWLGRTWDAFRLGIK